MDEGLANMHTRIHKAWNSQVAHEKEVREEWRCGDFSLEDD
jgi:hypothetical protein